MSLFAVLAKAILNALLPSLGQKRPAVKPAVVYLAYLMEIAAMILMHLFVIRTIVSNVWLMKIVFLGSIAYQMGHVVNVLTIVIA